jgi:hypothetical protein
LSEAQRRRSLQAHDGEPEKLALPLLSNVGERNADAVFAHLVRLALNVTVSAVGVVSLQAYALCSVQLGQR